MRDLAAVEPSPRAMDLAAEVGKDPRLVELILAESREVLRAEHGVLIVETNSRPDLRERRHRLLERARARAGWPSFPRTPTLRPAGFVPRSSGPPAPARPSSSSTASAGRGGSARPRWRSDAPACGRSTTGAAPPTAMARRLGATMIAIADEVAAAADLARDKASGTPVVVVSGLGRHVTSEDGPGAASLRRARTETSS